MRPSEFSKLSAEKCQAYNEAAAPRLYASLDNFKKLIVEFGGKRRRKKPQLELVTQ